MARPITGPIDLLPAQDLQFGEAWDPILVQKAIAYRTSQGRPPTFLFLGKTELELLHRFLKQSWGEESLGAKSSKYYRGLEVVEVDKPSMARIGGRKMFTKLKTTESKKKDSGGGVWQLKIGD